MPRSHDHLTPPDPSSIPSDGGRHISLPKQLTSAIGGESYHFSLPKRLTAALGAAAILLVGGAADTGYHIRETRDQITAHQTVKAGYDPFAWIGDGIGTMLGANHSPSSSSSPQHEKHVAPTHHNEQ